MFDASFPLITSFSNRSRNLGFVNNTPEQIRDNRREFLAPLGINSNDLVCCQQVHAGNVACVDETQRGRGALNLQEAIKDVDGLITNVKNLPLAVFTADCIPVFLYEPNKNVAGVLHASWRSSKDKICINAVRLMKDKFGINPSGLWVGLGPSIRECCYEVDEEFKEYFGDSLLKRDGRLYLDLVDVNKRQLKGSGVREERVLDSGICTVCRNDEFFSFRKEGSLAGRMISVIMLK